MKESSVSVRAAILTSQFGFETAYERPRNPTQTLVRSNQCLLTERLWLDLIECEAWVLESLTCNPKDKSSAPMSPAQVANKLERQHVHFPLCDQILSRFN